MRIQTEVLVIGGGVTGAGILRDLALRGVAGVLVERRDINAGASGANHGLLHSGGRYVVNDPESARECVTENAILRRVAPGCIEPTGGYFVALPGDDEGYAEQFLGSAAAIGLEATEVEVDELREQEPLLSAEICRAVRVPDAAINPFVTTLANLAAAEALGARVLLHTQVTDMQREGGRVVRVQCINGRTGEELTVEAAQVVNAAGPWTDQIGRLAGVEIPIAYSKGSLLITNSRLVDHVINRLRPPSDGDIIVPGDSVTITGTTSIRVRHLDQLKVASGEVDLLVERASRMMPALDTVRFIRVYAGVRPLVLQRGADGEDRGISRTFVVMEHEADGLGNLVSIAGGKLTTYRLMAEKTADVVARRLGSSAPCRTAEVPLDAYPPPEPVHGEQGPRGGEASTPRIAGARIERLRCAPPDGVVLCECEMVARDHVDRIIEDLQRGGAPVDLTALRLRSRLGMGSCQGGLCGFRTLGHLVQRGAVRGNGLELLIRFLEKRWGGIRPVLWGDQLRQEQLLEGLYCGTLNIDGDL